MCAQSDVDFADGISNSHEHHFSSSARTLFFGSCVRDNRGKDDKHNDKHEYGSNNQFPHYFSPLSKNQSEYSKARIVTIDNINHCVL